METTTMADVKKITHFTGLSRDRVEYILRAQLDFLLALGLAHGDENDEQRGAAMRRKYPDLLRASVASTAGRSPQTPVTYQLETTIIQLETDERPKVIASVIALANEGLVSSEETASYREWAEGWDTDA
jgi:hypothetical protein